MKNNGELPNRQMVVWIPYNFWEIIGDQAKYSPEFTAEIVNNMKHYMMFCLVDYSINNTVINFRSEDEIRKTLRLTDSLGHIFKPLNNEEVTPGAKSLVDHLQPALAQMMGQFGEGMRIFIFDAIVNNDKAAIEVTSKNKFSLSWDKAKMNWKLPFASVLPLKHCPVDNAEMKGNWNFCPEDGTPLNN
jgi:hypothetical protein